MARSDPLLIHSLYYLLNRSVQDFEKCKFDLECLIPDEKRKVLLARIESHIQDQRSRMNENQVQLITYWDDLYPESLRNSINPPPAFFCAGNCQVLKEEAFTIVGTRRAGKYGLQLAKDFAKELAKHFVIVSGLAFGIDSAAHEGALESGTTIAVLASGVDVPTPKSNEALYRRILKSGAVISTYPLGEGAKKHRFVERNYIMATLGIGCLVVEAPIKSGSLITAKHAAENGRDVFALPWDVWRKNSEGNNWLIKQGALLVTHPSDILEYYGKTLENQIEETSDPIIKILQNESLGAEEIAERLNLPLKDILIKLSELELEGKILSDNGKYYVLK